MCIDFCTENVNRYYLCLDSSFKLILLKSYAVYELARVIFSI